LPGETAVFALSPFRPFAQSITASGRSSFKSKSGDGWPFDAPRRSSPDRSGQTKLPDEVHCCADLPSCCGCPPSDDARTRLEVGGCRTGAALQGYTAAITVGNSQLTTSQPNVAGNVAAFAEQ